MHVSHLLTSYLHLCSTLEKGPFAAIIQPTINVPKPSSRLFTFLVEIQALSCPLATDPTPSHIVVDAAELLRKGLQYSLETSTHPALRATMMWPINLEPAFVDALKSRTDPAVRALFKQYCKVLEYASTNFWFLIGWRGISQQL
jgi:hypothetical protein